MYELSLQNVDLSPWVIVVRLVLATLFGGIVGLERATRRQTSGMRTFALLCLGSALTMIANIYIARMFNLNDPTRIPAAAIGSIGFLGVSTIFVAGRGQIRGMTTSVSLWTVSAIGIAVGAGLYICSVVTVILIMLINHVLAYISHYQEEMNKEIAFYVEIKEGDAVKELVAYLKDGDYKLSSIEKSSQDVLFDDAIGVKIELNFGKQVNHRAFLQSIKDIQGVYYIEEI